MGMPHAGSRSLATRMRVAHNARNLPEGRVNSDADFAASDCWLVFNTITRLGRGGPRLARPWLSKILICPADNTSSVATIETSMPAFTEAAMTLCARTLGLDATSEYVFA